MGSLRNTKRMDRRKCQEVNRIHSHSLTATRPSQMLMLEQLIGGIERGFLKVGYHYYN